MAKSHQPLMAKSKSLTHDNLTSSIQTKLAVLTNGIIRANTFGVLGGRRS